MPKVFSALLFLFFKLQPALPQQARCLQGLSFTARLFSGLTALETIGASPGLFPEKSKDGRRMVLIWSDAMKNREGKSHTVNYKWDQVEITILTK